MSASQNSVRDSVELFKMGSTFTVAKRIVSYGAFGALAWALAQANQHQLLPDIAATVFVGMLFIKAL